MAKVTHIDSARRARDRRRAAITGAGFALGVAIALALSSCGKAAAQTALVLDEPGFGVALVQPIRVIDGDTVESGGVRYRIANIDAPELYHPRCAAERALAVQSTQALGALILTADFVSVIGNTRDRYGRTLAHLYVNGDDAGELLVAAGLAAPWAGHHATWCEAIAP